MILLYHHSKKTGAKKILKFDFIVPICYYRIAKRHENINDKKNKKSS